MNYLRGKKCYLGGPIEHGAGDVSWREEPRRTLRGEFGIDLFDPFEDPKQQWAEELYAARDRLDYDKMAEIAERFVHKDLGTVDECKFLISYLPYKVATTGSHHEIINSSDLKKPTLLVCPQGKQYVPLWYYGFIPHQFMFGSFPDLYAYLREVDDGLHKDNKRWRMVYGLV